MMEKLSAEEFDLNFKNVKERFENAVAMSGREKDEIILLAATKTVDIDTINYAISQGINYIGENRVQELLSKYEGINEVHNHFIGHLQTNKVKDIIDKVEMIESVHSIKLAKEISKQAEKIGKVMPILIEVNIGNEESKSGFAAEETEAAVREIAQMKGIKVMGLMTIPPQTENNDELRKYFRNMYKLFVDIRGKKIDNSSMDILSMGMSGDFEIAIEEGATLVRVGTSLFGKRIYK